MPCIAGIFYALYFIVNTNILAIVCIFTYIYLIYWLL